MNHHALVYIAPSITESDLAQEYKTQSADVQHIVTDRFGIDDARALSMQASQSAVGPDGRIFVIATQNILPEAQNALLKLFEEPPVDVRFALVLPQETILIATLRSRVQVVQSSIPSGSAAFAAFQSSSYKERLEQVADLAKKKDVAAMDALVEASLQFASGKAKDNPDLVRSISFVASYMKAPGASRKMLLEELALSLPQG